ncbi:MAG: DUF309 domain-containing protein [Planctomycetota bacterium]
MSRDTTPVPRPVEGARGAPPLFLPNEPFPPYRFVPGHAPHPFAHKGGYGYGQRPSAPPFCGRSQWRRNQPYLRGLDFFNRGWWWEAHEAWESYWHVCEGRDEVQRRLVQGLIQLAACALNRERASDAGAGRLLFSAMEHFEQAQRLLQEELRERAARRPPPRTPRQEAEPAPGERLCGLDLKLLLSDAHKFLAEPRRSVDGLYLRPE